MYVINLFLILILLNVLRPLVINLLLLLWIYMYCCVSNSILLQYTWQTAIWQHKDNNNDIECCWFVPCVVLVGNGQS